MAGFVDTKNHLLYGFGDGPETYHEMIAMINEAYHDGIQKIIATPTYALGGPPFNERKRFFRILEANQYCKENNLDLEVIPGGCVRILSELDNNININHLPTLGNSNYVLVEFLPNVKYDFMHQMIERLTHVGYKVIISSIDEYRCLRMRLNRLETLINEFGAIGQIDCDSIVHNNSRNYKSELVESKLVTLIATGANAPGKKQCKMREFFENHENMCLGGKFDDLIKSSESIVNCANFSKDCNGAGARGHEANNNIYYLCSK